MDLTNAILSQLGSQGLSNLAGQIGADEGKTKSAIEGAIPVLLGAMSSNAKSSDGASSLMSALERDHDGSVFDNIGGLLQNLGGGAGQGILGHVLGGQQSGVEQALGKKTGLDMGQVSKLLVAVAPMVMGYLGKMKRQGGGGFDVGSIAGLLGGMAGESDSATDLDLGDVLGLVGGLGGSGQGQGGLGNILGGFLKG